MTNDADSAATEEELRNLYDSGRREQVPRRLDTAVMRAAKRELQNDKDRSWILPWRRRIAFAAMVSLSLAIVLEMSEVSVFEPDPFAMPEVEREFEAQAELGSLQMREIGKTAAHLSLGEDSTTGGSEGAGSACSVAQTETPAYWLECIAQLRAGGFGVDADAELRKLQLAFPDFSLAQ